MRSLTALVGLSSLLAVTSASHLPVLPVPAPHSGRLSVRAHLQNDTIPVSHVQDLAAAKDGLDDLASAEHHLLRRAVSCHSGFQRSPDKLSCVCPEGRLISADGQKCREKCTSGSFPSGDGKTCAFCPNPFARCSSATEAAGCIDGYFLSKKECLLACPPGQWGDAAPGKNRCRACADRDALTCFDGGKKSATSCQSLFLYKGECLAAEDIPVGFYADSSTQSAQRCEDGVKACIGTGSGAALACGKNKSGQQLFLTADKDCTATCPDGSYGNKALTACVQCDSSMKTCNADGALTCAKDSAKTQLYLTPSKNCLLPWVGPAGYWADDSTNTFVSCGDGISSCTSDAPGKALTCGKRVDGTPLYWVKNAPASSTTAAARDAAAANDAPAGRLRRRSTDVEGSVLRLRSAPTVLGLTLVPFFPFFRVLRFLTCLSLIPIRTAATSTCYNCDDDEELCSGTGAGSALKCKSGLYLSASHDCLTADQCTKSGAFFADDDTNACSPCDPGEAACTDNGDGFATACSTDSNGNQLYLQWGNCVSRSDCFGNYYPDDAAFKCKACGAFELSCTGPGAATACGVNDKNVQLYLDSGKCVKKTDCASTTWADPATRHCESCTLLDPDAKTCSGPLTLTCNDKFFWAPESACVDPCPERYFNNEDNHVCTRCADGDALSCTADKALSCEAKFLTPSGTCQEQCPPGYYGDDHVCVRCADPDAVECTATETLRCGSQYLWENRCTSCPAGMYGISADHTCGSCSSLWNDQTSECTETRPVTCKSGSVWSPFEAQCITGEQCSAIAGGYYPDGGYCRSCSGKWPYATSCTSTQALSCQSNYFVEAGVCAQTCRLEGYLNSATDFHTMFRGQYMQDNGNWRGCQKQVSR
ncbi:hypothetical protein JCM10213_006607 [Rhodosporidiobolus nylandii]